MEDFVEQAWATVGLQGRIVIPARIRRTLLIEPGDAIVVRVIEGRIVPEKRADVLARQWGRFEGVPEDVSLADELILPACSTLLCCCRASLTRGVEVAGGREDLAALRLTLASFTVRNAEDAASLCERTRDLLGLSLADRTQAEVTPVPVRVVR